MSRFRLEARDLSYAVGGKTILSAVSLGLHAGELGVVLGPSGSGKSTLIKLLARVRKPTGGVAALDGDDLQRLDAATVAGGIGYVPQDDIVHLGLRLHQALRYAALLRYPATTGDDEIDGAITRVLGDVELSDQSRLRIRRLSGGQRKRASLATELLLAPRVLLLDEPTSGLDPDLEATTMRLFRKLADHGRAVLTTTHATASLEFADLVVVIAAGHLVWAGPLPAALDHFRVADPDLIFRELRAAPAAEWQRRYARSATAARMRARPAPRAAPAAAP